MTRIIAPGAAAVAFMAALSLASDAAAQGRLPEIITSGPGSSIGVTVREVTNEDADKAKLAQPIGVYVESVREGSPAAAAGFKTGDIILDFDNVRVRGVRHFTSVVQDTPPRRQVEAVIVRGTSRETLKVVPEAAGDFLTRFRGPAGDFPRIDRLPREFNFDLPRLRDRELQNYLRGFGIGPSLGVSLMPLGEQLASYFGVKSGALVTAVTADSPASAAGLKAGDVITAVNGRSIENPDDVRGAISDAAAGSSVEVGIVRDKKTMTLKATMPERPARLRGDANNLFFPRGFVTR